MWATVGLRRLPFVSVRLMRTMLGMSSCDSTTPLARQVRAAARTEWWGLAPSMPLPKVQSRASRARVRSMRLMCRFVARAAARAILTSPRSASKTRDAAAGGASPRAGRGAARAFACCCALFAASSRSLRLLQDGFHMLASRAARAAAVVLALDRSAAARSSRESSTKRRATSQWLGLDSSAAPCASAAGDGRASQAPSSVASSRGAS
mmetsp:Transcript_85744/g.185088  ORF Transcript_85744/g.185088 Transcript_85744/m.185088 type:complete len:208 (-) Transcript_85744:12-635(-)